MTQHRRAQLNLTQQKKTHSAAGVPGRYGAGIWGPPGVIIAPVQGLTGLSLFSAAGNAFRCAPTSQPASLSNLDSCPTTLAQQLPSRSK